MKTITTILILFSLNSFAQKTTLQKLDTSKVVLLSFTDSTCKQIKSVRAWRVMQVLKDSATSQLFAGDKIYWDEKKKPIKTGYYFLEANLNWK